MIWWTGDTEESLRDRCSCRVQTEPKFDVSQRDRFRQVFVPRFFAPRPNVLILLLFTIGGIIVVDTGGGHITM
ncbi:hypothetical protein UC8_48700 [Roseimaritima ulvae]|uniref:Uncharacterized protein n=1 Tax=Roseimaritima ulvae TaxID=980254 RepID=A0A5B9QUW0_9BACT|nr:hypothetical protein UC8_48700 [Roseimaritima ulvae]